MARRLVERGVRFVSLFMAGQPWDTHTENNRRTKECCQRTDLPIGGLLTDLNQRGLLDSTLILWGGEFDWPAAAKCPSGCVKIPTFFGTRAWTDGWLNPLGFQLTGIIAFRAVFWS